METLQTSDEIQVADMAITALLKQADALLNEADGWIARRQMLSDIIQLDVNTE